MDNRLTKAHIVGILLLVGLYVEGEHERFLWVDGRHSLMKPSYTVSTSPHHNLQVNKQLVKCYHHSNFNGKGVFVPNLRELHGVEIARSH